MRTKFISLFFLVISLMFIYCSNDANADKPNEMGSLRVRLTDAPFPYDLVSEVNVTIFKLEARKVSEEGSEDTEGMEREEDDSEKAMRFIVLMETEVDVNLLDLTNGATEMLVDVEVPTGTYDLVRIYVRGINVLLTDGRTFDLKVPGMEQTGIKVFIKPGLKVEGGLSSDLLLDFDVSRSFVAKGNINRAEGINGFNFKPVIKARNMSASGTLMGNVGAIDNEMTLALEGAQISLFAADSLNTVAFSDLEGNYTIMGLQAGVYRVLAKKQGYISGDTLNISIVAANKTTQDSVLEFEEEREEGN